MLEVRTKTQQADILAQYLRDDPLHKEKNKEDSVLRKILIGLASGWLDFRDKINEVSKEYNPNIIEYINEQLPEIIESRNHALINDDFESEYLDGIVMAYQHIIEKFGA